MTRLAQLYDEYDAEFELFQSSLIDFMNGKKTAGKTARQSLLKMKKMITPIRKEIQIERNV